MKIIDPGFPVAATTALRIIEVLKDPQQLECERELYAAACKTLAILLATVPDTVQFEASPQ